MSDLVLVPREATEAMWNAGSTEREYGRDFEAVYVAMIAAAPPVDREALIAAALYGIDNVHDMDVSHRDYATAAVDAILNHLRRTE